MFYGVYNDQTTGIAVYSEQLSRYIIEISKCNKSALKQKIIFIEIFFQMYSSCCYVYQAATKYFCPCFLLEL
jgi:hypothetical protein